VSKYKRLGKNTILVFIGNVGSKSITFLMLPFYTEWLSVDDYGITDLITVYSTLLLGIVTCCLSEAIFIFPKGRDHNKQKEYFSSGLFFSFVCILFAFLIFGIIRFIFTRNGIHNSFTSYAWIIYAFIVITFLQMYVQQFSRSIDKIKVYAISGIVLTLSTVGLSFILIPKFGLYGYIYAQLISLILSTLYTFVSSKSYLFLSINSIKKVSCKEMLKYSIPLIPNGVMWWMISALNRPLMEKELGIDAIGVFAVANKFPAIMAVILSVFFNAWQISVLEEFRKDGYSIFYNKVLKVAFSVLILISCILILSSKYIITFFVDEKFYQAWLYIPVLTISILFIFVSGIAGTNFSASRESKYYFYSSVWGALSSIFFNFIFIKSYGIWGACISIILSHAIMAITRIKYSWQYVRIQKWYQYILMIIINSILVLTVVLDKDLIYKILLMAILILYIILINRAEIVEIKKKLYCIINKK